MADSVRYVLESLVPELDDLVARGYFTRAEVRSIAQQREKHEYAMRRRVPRKADFLRAFEYETRLEELRKIRRRKLQAQAAAEARAKSRALAAGGDEAAAAAAAAPGARLGRSIADRGFARRAHFILSRATRKWRGDLSLWALWLDHCRRTGARKVGSRALSRALALNPTRASLWAAAAAWEFETGVDAAAARALMQRGLRLAGKAEPRLWTEYFRLELLYALRLGARRAALGIDDDKLAREAADKVIAELEAQGRDGNDEDGQRRDAGVDEDADEDGRGAAPSSTGRRASTRAAEAISALFAETAPIDATLPPLPDTPAVQQLASAVAMRRLLRGAAAAAAHRAALEANADADASFDASFLHVLASLPDFAGKTALEDRIAGAAEARRPRDPAAAALAARLAADRDARAGATDGGASAALEVLREAEAEAQQEEEEEEEKKEKSEESAAAGHVGAARISAAFAVEGLKLLEGLARAPARGGRAASSGSAARAACGAGALAAAAEEARRALGSSALVAALPTETGLSLVDALGAAGSGAEAAELAAALAQTHESDADAGAIAARLGADAWERAADAADGKGAQAATPAAALLAAALRSSPASAPDVWLSAVELVAASGDEPALRAAAKALQRDAVAGPRGESPQAARARDAVHAALLRAAGAVLPLAGALELARGLARCPPTGVEALFAHADLEEAAGDGAGVRRALERGLEAFGASSTRLWLRLLALARRERDHARAASVADQAARRLRDPAAFEAAVGTVA